MASLILYSVVKNLKKKKSKEHTIKETHTLTYKHSLHKIYVVYAHKNVRFHYSFHLTTYKVDLTYLKVLTTLSKIF